MGWAILPVAGELLRELPTGGAVLVVLGGIAYTAGVPFYAARHLRWGHAVWHVFVMIGSLLHFFGVLLYVIPAP
jgi:hemolysin III